MHYLSRAFNWILPIKYTILESMRILLCLFLVLCTTSTSYALSMSEELAYRVRFSRADDVELLLKKGANPNEINNIGLPMVSVAAGRSDDDAVPVLRMLSKYGADLNRGGANNQYPILIAARDNNLSMMKFLIEEAKVDYSVRDLNGMMPYEIAEYYGNEEAASLIRELTEEKLAEERWLKSSERRDELIGELSDHYCKHQYMYYYYTSGQDKHEQDFIDTQIQTYRDEATAMLHELHTNFAIPYEYATTIKVNVSDVVKKELDRLVSNRERRRLGIGSQRDIKERCDRIVSEWMVKYHRTKDL